MGRRQCSLEGVGKLMNLNDFYKGKRVFITGHTGFKGAWMCKVLSQLGAIVTGYALAPPTNPSLYDISNIDNEINSNRGDVRDFESLYKVFAQSKPEIVIHMAAQPLVRESYINPRYTYETNVMGTVNILECLRRTECVRSFLNVTTDKVYLNREWEWGYRENDVLDGFDPYSNSKSCSELVTHSYKNSFFSNSSISISTARAGNVIGGGDFAHDRIIPDCVRSTINNKVIIVRNPSSVRPYQHVLEPICAYLLIVAKQYEDTRLSDCYNVGPDDRDCFTTADLVRLFVKFWGDGAQWQSIIDENAPHEANYLKLDCSKIKAKLGWYPKWRIDTAVEKTVEWVKCWIHNGDISALMESQINDFLNV